MEFVSYKQALDFINNDNGKIKVVVFSIADCPTCDDFLPHVFAPAIESRSEHFEAVKIDLQTEKMPFPPVSTPTVYFYIPNTTEPMPLFRVGGTTPTILNNDLDAMITIKDNGATLADAFYSKPINEVTSWVQRSL